jgi:hypothetical protein
VQMNRSYLCPIEDAICQSMLHIAKARRLARPLELRIVYHKLGPCFACGHRKNRSSLKQPIRYGVGKVSVLDPSERSADGDWVQQIALHNFRPELAESIGPCIQLMNEGTNRNTLVKQKGSYLASCGTLCAAGGASDEDRLRHVLLLCAMRFRKIS